MIRHSFSAFQKLTVFALTFAMFSPVLAFPGGPQPNAKPLTEDQKILHVLNRLGFGARPGDVEKVKAMGLQKYIDQQLNPSSINDSAAEAKVKNLDIVNMSTAELFEKYPNPGALLRQLEGGRKAQAAKAQAQQDQMPANGDKTADANAPQAKDAADDGKDAQKERREKLQALYREYDLRPAGQLVPQIVANRVLLDVYSERQLQQVMVDFWANHFNVFAGKAAVKWYIPSYERDVIRPNALGNFKDLLVGTAEHPAMLFYLDNFQSVSPNSQTQQNARAGNGQFRERLMRNGGMLPPQMREQIKMRQGITEQELDRRIARAMQNPQQQPKKKATKRGLNENYARELMELHTLGVNGGYTQQDVIEVAKCFTGWTIADPTGYRRAAANMIKGTDDRRLGRLQRQAGVPDDLDSGQFYFNPRWHESGPKYVLGQKIDEGGMKDGLKVLDILVNSPATAKFIARELAVKFISDNPSDALVNRVADAFHRSNGDIKTTLRALFSDPEFFAPENYRAKIKTPFELVVSAIRTLGADTNGSPALVGMLRKLGEVPYGYQAPTGYPDKAEDWVNTGALLERLNFAVAVASNRIPGTRVNLSSFAGKSKTDILNNAIAEILDGEVSPTTKGTLLKQLEQPLPEVKPAEQTDEMEAASMPAGNGKRGLGRQARLLEPSGNPDVFKAVSLVLGTPEFQRQ
ncbi:MAG TPA: DUF1800 domain-containing protein [Pyrinomonadaceae bacterium]|nr:DUF1800 domain-containing protein [Pyrinomonadaceae bacterium]